MYVLFVVISLIFIIVSVIAMGNIETETRKHIKDMKTKIDELHEKLT